MMKYILFILIVSPVLGTAQNRNTILKLSLTQLKTDSPPFLPAMRPVKKVIDTSIIIGQKPDSFILYRGTVIDDISNSFTEEQKQNNYLYFLMNRYDNNKFIFDSDMDLNFQNEIIYDRRLSTDLIKIENVKFYTGINITCKTIFLRPEISEIMINDSLRRILGLAIQPVYRYGKLKLPNNQIFKVAAFNMFENEYTSTSRIIIVPENKKFLDAKNLPVSYKVGDSLYLSNRQLVLKSINKEGTSITFEDLGKLNSDIGIEEGKIILPIPVRDIHTGSYQKLGKNGKLTLVEFWGTWCVPCIQLLPDIKALVEKNKIQLIKVAYDDSIKTVYRFLEKEGIYGINVFDDANNHILASQLKVRDFPTFLLVDSRGKILLRSVGKDGFKRLEDFLNTH